MRNVVILPSFERSAKKLTKDELKQLGGAMDIFNSFLLTGRFPYGFRFKKIDHDKYEFRIDIRLRVIIKEEFNIFYLVLVGDHDTVKRYLRNYK